MKSLTGILLVNLGTPKSPSYIDVYRYLIEFLTDSRVIDFSWLRRQFLVRGIIVPSRLRSSKKAYQTIWTAAGSPLLTFGHLVKDLLKNALGPNFDVEIAMRYQEPSIEEGLSKLLAKNPKKLLIIPLFPQYASATTGSVQQKVMENLKNYLYVPEVKFISQYPTHPTFISAFQALGQVYQPEMYDHILFSFHGLPQRHLKKMEPSCLDTYLCCAKLEMKNNHCYSAQCHATAQAIASSLNLSASKWSISFQSRLGKEPWMEPYTNEVILSLAQTGKKKILIFCPSFVCDCLETIYEIGIEYAHAFKKAGGESLQLVPGLNDHPRWIQTLKEMVLDYDKF